MSIGFVLVWFFPKCLPVVDWEQGPANDRKDLKMTWSLLPTNIKRIRFGLLKPRLTSTVNVSQKLVF